ncbi:MAG TPA: hypothetical protein VGI74_09775 [Streptosporangiaceae bacterium]|jgi:hypothetical protein
MAWRSRDLDRAKRVLQLAKQLDPARTALWDKRLRAIEHTVEQTQKPGESPSIPREVLLDPVSQRSRPSLAEEIAARLTAVGIEPTDPTLARDPAMERRRLPPRLPNSIRTEAVRS